MRKTAILLGLYDLFGGIRHHTATVRIRSSATSPAQRTVGMTTCDPNLSATPMEVSDPIESGGGSATTSWLAPMR